MKYRVHKLNFKVAGDQRELEELINNLEGEIIAVFPIVSSGFFTSARVDFIFIIEKVG